MNILRKLFKAVRAIVAFPFQLVGQLVLIVGLALLGIGEVIVSYEKVALFITEFKNQLNKSK